MAQKKSSLLLREHDVKGYERVIEAIDESVGLHTLIAIHSTKLGPALGGIRAYPYVSFEEGMEDVLRLSKGMTYKAAVAETGTGGGKSIIFTAGLEGKNQALLQRYAEVVNLLEGSYICAEDVGMTIDDLGVIAKTTRYAVGLPHPKSSGNPGPFTAWGTFRGIEAVCEFLFGSRSLKGKVVAIQGLGSVGMPLARYLFWAGARLIVADVNNQATAIAKKEFGAKVVSVDEIMSVACDVFAPCALGGILNERTIAKLHCAAVAGSANNQLLTVQDGERLSERKILYAPDYVINAGGLINVCQELVPSGYDPTAARDSVDGIGELLLKIFAKAKKTGQATSQVADLLAEEKIALGIGKRTLEPCFHH